MLGCGPECLLGIMQKRRGWWGPGRCSTYLQVPADPLATLAPWLMPHRLMAVPLQPSCTTGSLKG